MFVNVQWEIRITWIFGIREEPQEFRTHEGPTVAMQSVLLEVAELPRQTIGKVGDQYLLLCLAIDENVIGMDVADDVFVPIRVDLRGTASDNQQQVPHLFLSIMAAILLPNCNLSFEVGDVLVVEFGDESA